MKVARPTAFWIVTSAVAIVALILLRDILLPFIIGMAVAYLLAPVVDRLERIGINRSLATLTIVLSLVVAFVAVVLMTFPIIIGEVRFLIEEFPRYVARIQSLAMDASTPWLRDIMGSDVRIEQSFAKTVTNVDSSWVAEVLRSMWSGGQVLISIVSLLVVAPVVTIYLLIDWNRMIATTETWFPQLRRNEVRAVMLEIHDTVSGFVRGQAIICLILAVFYAAALELTGLNHALPIGIAAGLISFIPYLGAGAGLVISLCVAVAQFWPNWTPVVVVGLIFLLGETIADYVLAPRIIGPRVKLNPVWLMFALFAFGWLFGFVGLFIAVPLAASLAVLLRFAMRQFQVASLSPQLDKRAGHGS
jgi:predicted PurR-regulated permease PerM